MKATICVAAMLLSIASYAQLRPLAGKVVDPSGEPKVGATVVVPGQSNVGTATGADGSFQLMVPAQAASVTISCIGYVTQTVPIAG
ncbi:MAG: carboxypeptidase-like regulatory domain-containing protein, partial [Bacteroidales bacterium]|nr:carboxypeptidase-like regulatory domain-containing protein [Bacteroidales bacterium]